MTRQENAPVTDEDLSALVDGEAGEEDAAATVARLLDDERVQARWARYHAQRAALHGERTDWLSAGFADRVAAAVAEEPTVVAPQRWLGRSRPSRLWLRRFGGGAIAASIALVTAAILFGLEMGTDATPTRSADTGTQPVATDGVSPVRLTADAADGISRAARERLSHYLSSHAGAASGSGLPGVVRFSRLSGVDAGQ